MLKVNFMRTFESRQYIELVEKSNLKVLQDFMRDEKYIISTVDDFSNKNVIDLGAGHGRLKPFLEDKVNELHLVEINPEMYKQLEADIKLTHFSG